MIPLEYRLRRPVRVEPHTKGIWRVVCEAPLTVMEVNVAAARLLSKTREGASVESLAVSLCTSEERVLGLCEHFRARGILEARRTSAGPGPVPSVTVIVPTRDRAAELEECLQALALLDYPQDRLEVIVVDDGSLEPVSVATVVARHGFGLLVNERNEGPSGSRNRAALEARGEILAFVDSDCVAGRDWLRDLTPYFAWDRVGAVGGRTVGYFTESRIDRYEEVASPLDMGTRLVMEAQGTSTFYVPTCNLLVRRSIYLELGGLREGLSVGEDVDLCWRLRERGHVLIYAPEGIVRHRHRTALRAMLRRRMEYGTSEAALYALHPAKRKRFHLALAPLATAALTAAALLGRRPWLWSICLAPALCDWAGRASHLRRRGVEASTRSVMVSVARGHLSMVYFAHFHLVRYHLALLAALAVSVQRARPLVAFGILYVGTVDYLRRRPRLSYPEYLGLYLAEHAAYQAGVIAGCVSSRTLRPYRLGLSKDRSWSSGSGGV